MGKLEVLLGCGKTYDAKTEIWIDYLLGLWGERLLLLLLFFFFWEWKECFFWAFEVDCWCAELG